MEPESAQFLLQYAYIKREPRRPRAPFPCRAETATAFVETERQNKVASRLEQREQRVRERNVSERPSMRNVVRRLLLMQSVAAVCVAVLAGVIHGSGAAAASIYGGFVALIMTLMLAWRINQAAQSNSALRWLVIGAVERMIMVCAAFAVGIGLLGLQPVPILAGFGVAELAYYLAAGPMRRHMLELMGRRYDGQ